MGSQWVRMACDLDSNPKIRKAGRLGREVYLFALRRYGVRYGSLLSNGRLPSADLEPWFIADQLQMTEAEASDGLERCVTAKLLVRDGEDVIIAGYDSEWTGGSKTNAERQKEFRERSKAKRNETVTTPVTPVLRRNDSNGSDQIRSDQIRSEDQDRVPRGTDATFGIQAGETGGPEVQGGQTGEKGKTALRVLDGGVGQDASATPNVQHSANGEASKPVKPKRTPPPPPDQALTLAHLLLNFVCENHPTSRIAKAPERVQDDAANRWAETIDKLHRLDKFSWGEIEGMITWCQRDSFWKGVILGADNLRDKWDKMAAQRNRKGGVSAAPTRASFDDVLDDAAREIEQRKEQA